MVIFNQKRKNAFQKFWEDQLYSFQSGNLFSLLPTLLAPNSFFKHMSCYLHGEPAWWSLRTLDTEKEEEGSSTYFCSYKKAHMNV